MVFQPLSNWQIVASYSHVNHEFVTSSVASSIGETYPQAIRDRYALLTRYEFTQEGIKGLSLGLGISGGSRALMDYQTWNGRDVARYDPARMMVEMFAVYKFKLLNQNAMVQLNIKNLTKAPDYVGWKATGSPTILATERYKVPMPIVWRVTMGFDF